MKRAWIACAGLCALLGPTAGAEAGTIFLLSPITPVQSPPPLAEGASSAGAPTEIQYPGRLRNQEHVVVGLGTDGSAASVVVTQRLIISRTGDFYFIVPAPATSVAPAAGTEVQPGLRDLGVVWQGFSRGHRVLAATVALRLSEAVTGLPLSVSVRPRGGDTAVTLTSLTRRPLTYHSGTASLVAARKALVQLQATLRRADTAAASTSLAVSGMPAAGPTTTTVTAPFRLHGTIGVPGRQPVNVVAVLGNGHPIRRMIIIPGRVSPRIELRIDFLDPLELLPQPGELASAVNPLSTLQEALARVALSRQFERYLDSPDRVGPSSTTYLYRTLDRQPAAVPIAGRPGSSDDTLAIVLAATLGGAALLGLAVLWAHS